MEQNTNSASSLRLQPRQSNNIGNMVQEYIRYNRKYEDDKTAREKIEKAREAEFQFKLDGRRDKLFEALRPDDTIGYFNSQVVDAFEKNQDKLFELSQKASTGDRVAMMKYQSELTKWKNLSNAGNAFKSKIASNLEARKTGGYNSVTDEAYLNFEKSLLNGALNLNPETLETTITSFDGTDVVLPASKITTNEFFTHQFGKPADFQTQKKYANALINDIYVKNPNISDADASRLGLKGVRDIFATDPNEKVTWYGTVLKQEGKDPRQEQPFEKLPLARQNEIAEKYLKEFTFRPEKTTKEKQAEANLRKTDLDIAGKDKDNKIKQKRLDLLNNPPPEEDKSTEASKKRDYTRILVDGIKAGDLSSIQTLVDLQASSSKKGFISDVDYSNGILEYKFTKKDGDEDKSEILKIDMSKPDASARILALLYPTTDPANSMYNYEFGKPLKTFEENKNTGITKFTEEEIRNSIVLEDDKKTVENLKKLGVKVEATGVLNDVVKYKGKEYDAENKEELDKLVNKIIEDKKGGSKKETTTKKTIAQIMKENNISFKEATIIYNAQ